RGSQIEATMWRSLPAATVRGIERRRSRAAANSRGGSAQRGRRAAAPARGRWRSTAPPWRPVGGGLRHARDLVGISRVPSRVPRSYLIEIISDNCVTTYARPVTAARSGSYDPRSLAGLRRRRDAGIACVFGVDAACATLVRVTIEAMIEQALRLSV